MSARQTTTSIELPFAETRDLVTGKLKPKPLSWNEWLEIVKGPGGGLSYSLSDYERYCTRHRQASGQTSLLNFFSVPGPSRNKESQPEATRTPPRSIDSQEIDLLPTLPRPQPKVIRVLDLFGRVMI